MEKRHYIIPIFVPHKGCPHDCIFCNQKKITGQDKETTAEEVQNKIQEYLSTIPKESSVVEVAFYGGSFTAIPIDTQKELLEAAQPELKGGRIHNIRISTRPDCIDRPILDTLKKYGVTIVELGVQSMDEDILRLSQRGHTAQDVTNAVGLLKEYGFTVGVQMMVGLPGDTRQSCIDTAKSLIKLRPAIARIYPALVIKNTYMEILYREGRYTPPTLQEAVSICKDLLILFEKNNIQVIRIGLQPTENILPGKDVVAGPFHPAMRQMVESAIYRDMVEDLLADCDLQGKDITLSIHPKTISNLLGQKRSNVEYIKKHHGLKNIHISQDKQIEPGTVVLNSVDYFKKMEGKHYYSIKDI